MAVFNLTIPFLIAFITILGCSGKSEKEFITSGRLKFVKTLRYGSVGTHGSQGWYVSDRQFEVDGKSWKPSGINVNDHIAGCEPSPNSAVEGLKCYSFTDSKELVYVLTMRSGKPIWTTASDVVYRGGKNLGEWVGDGHWLLFKDHYFNVETSELSEVVGLPDFPENHFRGTSPDLATIIYEDDCFPSPYDSDDGPPPSKLAEERCKVLPENLKKGIAGYWLIEASTGAAKIIEFKKEKYDWLYWDQNKFPARKDWARNFQTKLQWETDKNGKFQLIFPN